MQASGRGRGDAPEINLNDSKRLQAWSPRRTLDRPISGGRTRWPPPSAVPTPI